MLKAVGTGKLAGWQSACHTHRESGVTPKVLKHSDY